MKRYVFGALSTFTLLLATLISAAQAQMPFETSAKQAILVDTETGRILYEKNADELMPPSSMSKLMTLYVLFEQLSAGGLTLQDTFPVSEKAWRTGGSKMFVLVNTRVSVEDLIRGIIIQSGNDACVVVAEGMSGTEEAFAAMMTEKGRQIGLTHSTFRNAHGLPDPDHLMTARDLAVLAQRLTQDFPEYYPYFAEREFTYSEITQPNRNTLIGRSTGVDGLKTGATDAAGYGLVASAIRNERRLISVMNGLDSVRLRSRESERLLDWGYREFGTYKLFDAGQKVDDALVWLGDADSVPLVVENEIRLTLPRSGRRGMEVIVAYDSPAPAPVIKGSLLGRLIVRLPGEPDVEFPLVAAQNVGLLDFAGRIGAAANYLLFGTSGNAP